ncbi:hypothetical protein MD484_g8280, partial [Candolleomyces efflorescens]
MDVGLRASLCFSDLPEDVCRLVFEFAAELDEQSGRACALVSRKVNTWIDPILYRKIVIKSVKQLRNLLSVVQNIDRGKSTKRPDFLSTHVKTIIVDYGRLTGKDVLPILKPCRSIEVLALWHGLTPEGRLSKHIMDFMASPDYSPRRISIINTMFPRDDLHFSYPIFRNATHVELQWEETGPNSRTIDVGWDTLRCLPRLTHLSVNVTFRSERRDQWIREIVQFLPLSLRVFVVWIYDPRLFYRKNPDFEGLKAIQDGDIDSRIVLAYEDMSPPEDLELVPIFRAYRDMIGDWTGTRVGLDVWTLAERKIEERLRRGKK